MDTVNIRRLSDVSLLSTLLSVTPQRKQQRRDRVTLYPPPGSDEVQIRVCGAPPTTPDLQLPGNGSGRDVSPPIRRLIGCREGVLLI